MSQTRQPNLLYVFADQWRADALGYAGDPNVKTPHLDAFAAQSLNLTHAFASAPVCTPYRATLMSGQHPHTHGLFVNDAAFEPKGTTLGQAFKAAGYTTAYIGKWHINGHGRYTWIPPERRFGFDDLWKVLECTHRYPGSPYYEGDSDEMTFWDGYDAIDQTTHAIDFLRTQSPDSAKPFVMLLSWGPPHAPLDTAPQSYQDQYDPATFALRPNVPAELHDLARKQLAGYYAHCTALDDCWARLMQTLDDTGLAENTIVVFTSDHGDMLQSQGQTKKQRPWEESMHVPFLIRWPAGLGRESRRVDALIDSVDIMPTLLSLCSVPIPDTVEGLDRSAAIRAGVADDHAALYNCLVPFGQWTRPDGGRESRGLRTNRYTYVRDRRGPWLLYDNQEDPYQLQNRVDDPDYAAIREQFDRRLDTRLQALGDAFLAGEDYLELWGYTTADPVSLTLPIRNWNG